MSSFPAPAAKKTLLCALMLIVLLTSLVPPNCGSSRSAGSGSMTPNLSSSRDIPEASTSSTNWSKNTLVNEKVGFDRQNLIRSLRISHPNGGQRLTRRQLVPVSAGNQRRDVFWDSEGEYRRPNGPGKDDDKQLLNIRSGQPEDVGQLYRLYIQMMDQHHGRRAKPLASEDPSSVAIQNVAKDFGNGRIRALVAELHDRTIVAYALYYYDYSSHHGKIISLKELFTDPAFNGLGDQLLLELAKEAHTSADVAFIEWTVSREEKDVFSRLSGAKELIQEANYWILPVEAFERVLDEDEENDVIAKEESTKNDAKRAKLLAERWSQLMNVQRARGLEQFTRIERVEKLLFDGVLCVATASLPHKIMGMALYHCNAHASWTGQYIWLDGIATEFLHRNSATIALMAHLVNIATEKQAIRIEWATEDQGMANSANLFTQLGAIDMTKEDGWLLYRWDYRPHLQKKG